jgi:hypothetical protein
VALLLTVGAGRTRAAESPGALLEKGVYAEETTGDLDAAISTYKQILDNPEATRPVLAQAEYRLAQCYLKKGQQGLAAAELRNLVRLYPGEKALVAEAQQLLSGLLVVDPATLMPPDTMLYVELGSPGRQFEKVLKMLEGTPLAGGLAAARAAQGTAPAVPAAGAGPAQALAALMNPSMIAEFKKVRAIAFGLQQLPTSGGGSEMHQVSVLCLGESDALKGMALMVINMSGKPAEPMEGMQTVLFSGPGRGGCAYDDSVIIIAAPLDALKWAVKQYKSPTAESLASGTGGLALPDRGSRQEAAMTVWANVPHLAEAAGKAIPAGQVPPQFAMADAFVKSAGLQSGVLQLVVDEKDPYVEMLARMSPGAQPSVLDAFKTPPISGRGFEAVPAEAVAAAASAPGGAMGHLVAQVTGEAVAQALLADAEQVTSFLMPVTDAAGAWAGDQRAVALQCGGIVISSRNPEGTRAALDAALSGMAAGPAPETEGIREYAVQAPQWAPSRLYVGTAGALTVIAADRDIVLASLAAARTGRSALKEGPLHERLSHLEDGPSKLVLANAGRLVQMKLAVDQAQGGLAEEQIRLLNELSRVLAATNVELRTVEAPEALTARLAVNGLPPLATVLPLLTQISQYRPQIEPTVIEVRHHQGPITVDGDLAEWTDVAPLPTVENQLPMDPLKLCWREEGVYGSASTIDSSVQPDLQQPWMGDGLQVFVETDAARAGQQTANCFQVLFQPAPESGEGKATINFAGQANASFVTASGLEPNSGVTCAWRRTDVGYTLEFFIPARDFKLAALQPGAAFGLLMMLRDGSVSPVAFVTTQTGSDVYLRPDKWALIRLAKEPAAPAGPQAQ